VATLQAATAGGGGGDARVLPETDRPQRNRVTKRKRTGKESRGEEGPAGIGAPRGEKTDRLNQQPAAARGEMSARSHTRSPRPVIYARLFPSSLSLSLSLSFRRVLVLA